MLLHMHKIMVKSFNRFSLLSLADKKHTCVISARQWTNTSACREHFIWWRQIIAYTFWNNVTHSAVHTPAALHKGKHGCMLLFFFFWCPRLTGWDKESPSSHYTGPSKHTAAMLTDDVFTCATSINPCEIHFTGILGKKIKTMQLGLR